MKCNRLSQHSGSVLLKSFRVSRSLAAQLHTSSIVASGLSFSGSRLSSQCSCFLPCQNQLISACYRSQLSSTTPFFSFTLKVISVIKVNMEFFFRYTGLAGVSSETSSAILNASPQNSPGEVKSPSAAGKNSCIVLVLRYYYCYYNHVNVTL